MKKIGFLLLVGLFVLSAKGSRSEESRVGKEC